MSLAGFLVIERVAQSLRCALEDVSDSELDRFTNEEFGDFKSWISDVIKDVRLKQRLIKLIDKDKENEVVLRRVVEEYIREG